MKNQKEKISWIRKDWEVYFILWNVMIIFVAFGIGWNLSKDSSRDSIPFCKGVIEPVEIGYANINMIAASLISHCSENAYSGITGVYLTYCTGNSGEFCVLRNNCVSDGYCKTDWVKLKDCWRD